MKTIQVARPSMPDFEEYVAEIRDLWENQWLTNMGAKHTKLEKELSTYLDTPHVSLFTNGHLALEIAIEAFKLTGEVITTPFSFASTTQAIVRKGLVPVFCDINSNDYTIDTTKIESLITDKTSAIIPVHVYGNVCNMDEIERIAKKYNLKVIYDAAHAFGVTIDGVGVGNFGDASMFSFHATKVFNTIEGGCLTFHEKSLYQKLNSLKNFGITSPETVDYIGGNAKMNEFQAAMGLCNLKRVNSDIEKRKAIVDRYVELLGNIPGIKLVKPQSNIVSNYSYFPVLFDGYRMNRNEVCDILMQHNIISRKYFYPLISNYECYKDMFIFNETPVASYISERILTLPLYADLELETVDKICEIIIG
ncbi:DegT/DnrJ/EryC1/StrS family aminotransferase [Metabacillus niabensis]|uniref:dTDP-4-amino-4,6-dideoxygalactose transaminase n=1 Tax=Metabacillus niabensis TaxID=324854 RepID=A0ABT9Z4E1_9BACI|nr:DegT/DnrJ/EryC1/StrS family aminotransferase [Metabacillus niabensis]MDQ0227129.1 dTDP-4-amino-4,6-dideoxygalactose transaminase [Metabacillus niabensis]